jgi:ligand-binding sensor domain-containing protein
VTALLEDRQGRIWVGTNEGLDVIEHERSHRCNPSSARRSAVHLIYEDRAGNLWVATESHGLFVIGADTAPPPGVADGLPSDWVVSIHEDERGVVWLGTTDGLALWRDGKLISLARFGGPLRETILQVLEDDAHQIWFTTNKGLMSVSRGALDALAAGGTPSPDFHVYGVADGLRTAEFDGGNTSAGCRDAGRHALVSERARHRARRSRTFERNTLPPPVHIEQVAVDGTPVTLTDGIEIAPGAQQWEFHYTG